jgi:chromosome segregation ATPase
MNATYLKDKFDTIKDVVDGIEFDYDAQDKLIESKEELESTEKSLKKSQARLKELKDSLAHCQEEHAVANSRYEKYRDAVNAGYDDHETVNLRNGAAEQVEAYEEDIKELGELIEAETQAIADLRDEISSLKADITTYEDEIEEHPLELTSQEANHQYAYEMLLDVEHLAGKVRLTLALGGPNIFLYADWDGSEASNAKLVGAWWGDRSELEDSNDVLKRFVEYVVVQ